MALPKSWTKITPFSKALALGLFILVPIGAFYLGIYHEEQTRQGFPNFACKQWDTVCDPDYAAPDGTCAIKSICVNPNPTSKPSKDKNAQTPYQTPSPTTSSKETVMCTMDAKQCPDGSWVGRSGPKCEFKACPTNSTK